MLVTNIAYYIIFYDSCQYFSFSPINFAAMKFFCGGELSGAKNTGGLTRFAYHERRRKDKAGEKIKIQAEIFGLRLK